MPWTGGAFLVGAMAIAGLPPLNGFSSEWLTLQALLHVSAYGNLGDGMAGAVALAALGATVGLAVFCFVKVVGLVLLGRPRRDAVAAAVEAPRLMWGAVVFLALACVALGLAPGLLFGLLAGLAPWPAAAPTHVGLDLPGTGSLPTLGIAVVLVGLTGGLVLVRGRRSAAPAPTWASGQLVESRLNWTSAGFTKPLRLVLEAVLRPQREITVRTRGRRRPGGELPRARAAADRRARVPAGRPALAGRGDPCAAAAERKPRDVRRLPDRARRRPARGRPVRGGRMSTATLAAGAAQIVGGILLAPLLPGLVQHWKARLQGRRGPSPLQPYRELRRLWGKSAVTVEGASVVYRLAPAVVAASLAAAVLLVPAAELAPNWGVGHDLLALAGFLALARFAVAAASWDVSNGFSLMGASRDLTLAVFVEVTLVLSIAIAALVAGTTDLPTVVAGTAGTAVWSSPALALGAVAFSLVVLAETGRQPIDNPDTHLELTMIHEGPLLEYAGRDLAYLQWAASARHWIVLVIGAQVFLPHSQSIWWQLALLPVVLVVLCAGLALAETLVAKMRVLLVPRLLAVGAVVALLGIATWLVGTV